MVVRVSVAGGHHLALRYWPAAGPRLAQEIGTRDLNEAWQSQRGEKKKSHNIHTFFSSIEASVLRRSALQNSVQDIRPAHPLLPDRHPLD